MPIEGFSATNSAVPNAFSLINLYPALTVGLTIFTLFLFIIDLLTQHSLGHKFALYPGAIFEFDLNRLSFYLLFHTDFFHWLFNVIALFQPLATYERAHGTIYTGVLLNLLTVVAGLQYSILGTFLVGNQTKIIGLSGIVFLLLAYTAYKEHFTTPVLYTLNFGNGRSVQLPTLYSPFVLLVACTILLPNGSFLGHLCGISAGYLLGMDYLKILFPPHKIILFIDSKCDRAIRLLDGVVVFVREGDAVSTRSVGYVPILSNDLESAA